MLAKPWTKLLRHRTAIAFMAAALLLTAAIGFADYQRLFSSFAAYDDEGYVMLSLRQFMAGGALYDEVYSQYGPAYYWIVSSFHWATDWPVTHDVTRLKTLAVWISVAVMAAAWLFRITRSGAMAAIGLMFVSFHLERLAMEPGHPQELCLLAVAACMVLTTFVRSNPTDLRMVGCMGIATAVCLMTKVNVGVFLLLSISAALLFATRFSRTRNLLLSLVLVAMIALPIVIGRHELFSWHGHRLPVLLTTAIALTVWISGRVELKPMFVLRQTFCFWIVAAFVSLVIATATIAAGTSYSGLANGMFLQHLSFVDVHYHAPPIHAFAPLTALLATLVARRSFAETNVRRAIQLLAIVLVVGAATRHWIETFQPLFHGSQDRGHVGLLVSYFAPFVWIILIPRRDDANETQFARLSLCLIAVLQPLIAYPVPGTQMAIGSLALVVALLTAIHDAADSFRNEGRFQSIVGRGLIAGLGGILLTTVISRDVYLSSKRSELPNLNLAGSSRLRLPTEFAAREQWTVEQLRTRADTFVCLPSGHNSLYLWSGIDPPTGFNATVWPDLLTEEHQRAIVAAIDSRQSVCIVVQRDEPSSLRTAGVLLDYIRDNFEPVAAHGTREIWQRRPIRGEMSN